MKDYIIFTDATTDIPVEEFKKYNIQIIPMNYTVDGIDNFYDGCGSDWNSKEFYKNMINGSLIQTSQIPYIHYIKKFEQYLERGLDILYICFSSSLSGTRQSAQMAIEKLKNKYPQREILCIDSLSASIGAGMLTLAAAQNKLKSFSIHDNAAWLEYNKLSICHWFIVNDLMYLKRGGRISSTSAYAGTILQVKPILHMDDKGHLVPVAKERGRKKAFKFLVDQVQHSYVSSENDIVIVGYSDSEIDAKKLAENIKEVMPNVNVLMCPIGPIIAGHTGPGLVGVFFFGNKR